MLKRFTALLSAAVLAVCLFAAPVYAAKGKIPMPIQPLDNPYDREIY